MRILNQWRSSARRRLSRPLSRVSGPRFGPQPVLVFAGPYLGQVSRCRCGAYADANRLGPHDTCQYCTPLPVLILDRRDAGDETTDSDEAGSTLETYGLGPDGATDAQTPRVFSVLTAWLSAYLAREWQMTPEDFETTYAYDDSLMVLDEAEHCAVRQTGLRIW